MIKYIGGALLVATGWLLGNAVCSVYSDRIQVLDRFREFVLFCESEINYYKTDMNAIIEKFIAASQSKYDENIFSDKFAKKFISKDCLCLMQSFPEKVRTLDSESLRGYINQTLGEISFQKEKAVKNYEIKGKMIKKLLPIAAVGIFILTL